jgi:hypothetical protein
LRADQRAFPAFAPRNFPRTGYLSLARLLRPLRATTPSDRSPFRPATGRNGNATGRQALSTIHMHLHTYAIPKCRRPTRCLRVAQEGKEVRGELHRTVRPVAESAGYDRGGSRQLGRGGARRGSPSTPTPSAGARRRGEMKGLDTPVLLEILHGSASGRALLKTLRGDELATSEINMFELVHLAAQGPRNARGARHKALAGLRRRITVIPVTARSVERTRSTIASPPTDRGYTGLIWGTMVDAGCGEWLTTRSEAPPKGSTGMRTRVI